MAQVVETIDIDVPVTAASNQWARFESFPEFLSVVEVLEQFGAVHDRALTEKGRLIAGLRHDNELLLAEAVSRGVLADLTLAEAAAMCSAVTE